jgi:gamma-butyrobetaine dioxygenase
MLQAAGHAEALGAGAALVVAALLHDVGHFLERTAGVLAVSAAASKDAAVADRPAEHARDGAQWLARWFGPAVTEPVRLHVGAKRYLCATEPAYRDQLSAASQRSLRLQGGPMGAAEAAAFSSLRYAADAVLLRRCDERAKDPAGETPGLGHFLPLLRSVLR